MRKAIAALLVFTVFAVGICMGLARGAPEQQESQVNQVAVYSDAQVAPEAVVMADLSLVQTNLIEPRISFMRTPNFGVDISTSRRLSSTVDKRGGAAWATNHLDNGLADRTRTVLRT